MSRYLKEIVIKSHFEGDDVTAVFRPANIMDFVALANAKGTIKSESDKAELVKVAVELLPRYVVRVVGLKDQAGEDVPIEAIFSSVYFMGLVAKWMGEWMKGSQPSDPRKPAASSSG